MLCLIKINTLDQPTLLDWRYLQLPACISLAPTQSLHLVPIQLQRRFVPAVLVQKAMQTQIPLVDCNAIQCANDTPLVMRNVLRPAHIDMYCVRFVYVYPLKEGSPYSHASRNFCRAMPYGFIYSQGYQYYDTHIYTHTSTHAHTYLLLTVRACTYTVKSQELHTGAGRREYDDYSLLLRTHSSHNIHRCLLSLSPILLDALFEQLSYLFVVRVEARVSGLGGVLGYTQ